MNPQVKSALQIAGVTLAGSLLMVGARKLGVIDGDTATRITMALIGLVVAWYGNITPKQEPAQSARRIAYRRFVGYAIAVAGLINAAIWIWAPMSFAAELSMAPLAIALLAILTYCLWGRGGDTRDASA